MVKTTSFLDENHSRIKSYIDVSDLRLGDRMAAAWYAQQRRLKTAERFGVIDRQVKLAEPFPMDMYFPDTFSPMTDAQVKERQLNSWDQGVLWLTATNEFFKNPTSGIFEHIPSNVQALAQDRCNGKTTNRPVVLIHVLDDATYNHRRNWSRHDANSLANLLDRYECEVRFLNPAKGRFIGSYGHMLAEMLAADAFIGGDTGPSHVFAMLCPEKPQLAIYPDMSYDRVTYQAIQRSLDLPRPWTSLPLRKALAVLELTPSHGWVMKKWKPKRVRLGRFNPRDAATIMLSLLFSQHR